MAGLQRTDAMSRGIASSLSADFEQATAQIIGAKTRSFSSQSPLRYPGGKTRAVSTIRRYIPDNIEAICSPFFGGGSVELSCATDGIVTYGSDAFQPVVNFWKEALKQPVLLSEQVRRYYPMTKRKFYSLQKNYGKLKGALERAAVFYVLNRSSFSGTTLSGGMSPGCPRFTESAIKRLKNFRTDNLQVEYADYKVALDKHSDKFLYLDPPYANGGRLYGNRGNMHEGFQHEELAEILRGRKGWLLSYNDCKQVRELYSDYEITVPEWAYGMNNNRASNEVLIASN